jgi:hypothetical protein
MHKRPYISYHAKHASAYRQSQLATDTGSGVHISLCLCAFGHSVSTGLCNRAAHMAGQQHRTSPAVVSAGAVLQAILGLADTCQHRVHCVLQALQPRHCAERAFVCNATLLCVVCVLSCRNKLTKLAGNKTERRKLSKQIQGLLQEEVLGKTGGKKQQPAAAAAAAETMAE